MTAWTLSIDAQICDHMVMELNQSGFIETLRAKAETDLTSMSGPYGTATRTYLPEYDHDMPQEYRVSVYPLSMTQSRFSRCHMREDYQINMVLYKRVTVGEERSKVTIEGDKVTKLADQIRKWWEWGSQNSTRVQDGVDACICARWMRCQRDPIFALAEVSEFHTVFIPIVHTWMLVREIQTCGSKIQRPVEWTTEEGFGASRCGR